jgi:hypothetical protein
MRTLLLTSIPFLFLMPCLSAQKSIPEDEVSLRDRSSVTGKILVCDSISLLLRRNDCSRAVVHWADVDSVGGLRHATWAISGQAGLGRTPYFSVFENRAYTPSSTGLQARIGKMTGLRRFRYLSLEAIAAKPYGISKIGIGTERFLTGNYLRRRAWSAGISINLMNVERNNGPQVAVQPYTTFYWKIHPQFLLLAQAGLQINPLNKNNRNGASVSVGGTFLLRHFERRYAFINANKRLPKRFSRD